MQQAVLPLSLPERHRCCAPERRGGKSTNPDHGCLLLHPGSYCSPTSSSLGSLPAPRDHFRLPGITSGSCGCCGCSSHWDSCFLLHFPFSSPPCSPLPPPTKPVPPPLGGLSPPRPSLPLSQLRLPHDSRGGCCCQHTSFLASVPLASGCCSFFSRHTFSVSLTTSTSTSLGSPCVPLLG